MRPHWIAPSQNTHGRPWGVYTILHETHMCKVKEIVVYNMQRLSYQSHEHRDEHWFCVQGEGVLTLDDLPIDLRKGEHVDIPRGTKHRIQCTSPEPLVFIVVQTGDSFAEEDIVRYDDDYGRSE